VSGTPSVAYKVLLSEEAAMFQATGCFAGSVVDLADGYIHLSTAGQLDETVSKHFAGVNGLQLAAVDLTALGDAVRWEPSRGGQLFPHICAPLPLSVVIACEPLELSLDGKVKLNGSR
jgi:uncharacterized protein (DUF952 family)